MKNKIKIKGMLKSYISISVYLGVLLCAVDLAVWFLDVRSALVMTAFTFFYFLILFVFSRNNKPIIMNELISFATEYGQIQRQLLRELEVPYVLLDDSGRVFWTNKAFEQVVHKGKGYRKAISTLIPELTRDKLPGETDATEVEISFEGSEYLAKCRKVSLKEMAENSDIISPEGYDGYLIAVYLFDETALKIALRENDAQSLVVGLLYLDNYEEALESVEEVRRSLLTALIERKIN